MAGIKLRLRTKLLSGFVIVSFLGLGASLAARFNIADMGTAMADQYHLVTQPTLQLNKISQTFQNMGIASRDMLLSGNDADLIRARSYFDGQVSFMEGALQDLESMVTDAGNQATIKTFREKLGKYQDDIGKLGETAASKDQAAIGASLKGLRSEAVGLQVPIDSLLDSMEALAASQAEAGAARVQVATLLMGIFGLATLGLSLVLGLVLSRRIAGPIAAIGKLSADIAAGDLTGTIAPRLLGQQDEIGELSRAIQLMKADILANISGIKEAVSTMEGLGGRLIASAADSRQAVIGIQSGVQTASARVLDQSAGVTETSATVNQILKNIEQLDQRIESQASAVTQSSASIEEMISNIQSVSRNVEMMGQCFLALKQAGDTGNDKLAAMARLIQSVAGNSEKLLAANETVNNIAAQTNLLAMNAAIEAAHAGDSGRGFAVVADEIRKLAELSSRQSHEISLDIREIRSVIKAIVGSSDETGRSFADIMVQMQTLGQMEGEIKRAMLEQGEGSHQILEAIAGINDVTADVRRGSHEITDGSQAIAREMKELMEASMVLQASIQEIQGATLHIGIAADTVVSSAEDSGATLRQLASRVERYTV